MDIRNIDWPKERPAILEHIRVVHGPGDSDLLGKWYGTMPHFDPADCFVVDGAEGEIAAHTMLIPRIIRFGDSILPASEIGVVGTLETYRGSGYATALMERSLERMTERGDAVSILFGIPNFYERWGFEYGLGLYLTSYESSINTDLALKAGSWDLSHSHQRRMASWLGLGRKEVTVRPFSLSDLPAVMHLYRVAAALGHSVIARDEETWLWQINYMTDIGRNDNASFLVAEHEGAILGYLRMVTSGVVNWFRDDASRFSIIEFAGDDPDATDGLLSEAAACARDFNADRIGLYVHPQSMLMTHALVHGAVQRSFTGAGFIRLNDLTLTLEAMANTLENRLAASPYNGRLVRLQVAVENQSAEVIFGGGDKEDPVTLEAPATDMIRLFSGWYGLSNISAGGYSEGQAGLLSALFPKGDPKVGLADLL